MIATITTNIIGNRVSNFIKSKTIVWFWKLIRVGDSAYASPHMRCLHILGYINSRVSDSLNVINCKWCDMVDIFPPETVLCRKIWINVKLSFFFNSLAASYIYIYIYIHRVLI